MYDPNRIILMLNRIEDAISLIQNNTAHYHRADDFLNSQDGMFALSGVCMQLIFIGETVKVLDTKTNHEYLVNYPEIPWNAIMGLRDIIAHEYQHIDAEEIIHVIEKDLPSLLKIVKRMKKEIEKRSLQ